MKKLLTMCIKNRTNEYNYSKTFFYLSVSVLETHFEIILICSTQKGIFMVENLKNKKINYLTILYKATDNQDDIRRNKWFCRCKCGKILKIRAEILINKAQKSCGCKRTEDLTQKKFGKLLVLKRFKDSKYSDAQWLCRCECGKEKIVTSSHLKNKEVKSCGCILNKKSYKEISGVFFGRIKHSAKIRNIPFDLNIEQIWNLFINQNRKCALTGLLLNFSSKSNINDGTASLDRIDSNKGYKIDNVQWVHKDINYMKQDFYEVDFIKYCQLVVDHFKVKK